MKTQPHCPICGKSFDENEESAALPFCSRRCKLIDAGRWLDENYGLPIESVDNEDWPRTQSPARK